MKQLSHDRRLMVLLVTLASIFLSACAGQNDSGRIDAPTSSVSAPEVSTEPSAPVVDALPLLDEADLEPFPGFGTGTVIGANAPVPVLVAETSDQRSQGLMHVADLEGWVGMWFEFPEPTSGSFWMKDTLLPLSIAWVDADRIVVAMADMEPCRSEDCPSYFPGVDYVSALEVEQGQLDELGISLGTVLTLSK
ncbi:MAG: DUF192 domain-containing protein [Actinobacteria bacterium]|nr:DUF192 domain-containing protein [Actinomycetota bacterium]